MIDWILDRDHPFSTYEAFSEKLTFLTPWYAYLCIRVYEIVVFWETFVTLDKRRQEKITFDHYHFQGSFRMTHRIYDSNMNNGWQNFLRYLSALKKWIGRGDEKRLPLCISMLMLAEIATAFLEKCRWYTVKTGTF